MKRLCDLGDLLGLHCLREGDFEDYEEVSEFIRLLVIGHTVTLDGLDLIWLDNLTRFVLDADLATVQVSQHEVHTSEGLEKSDFLLHEEVCASSLEGVIRFLLDLDDYITWLDVRIFISLTVENVFFTIGRALVNLDLKDLLILSDLLAFAGLALILFVDLFALAFAVFARTSTLSVHARSKLLHNSSHPLSFAFSACADSTSLATKTITLSANAVSVDSDLC